MPGTDKRRSHHRIPIFVLVASLVALFGVAATSNPKQEGAEKILKEGRSRNNVTEITKLKLKGATVLFAKKFPGDDDWLNGLTISVKNISPKPMVYIELELILFGEGDKEPTGKPLYIYPLTYGRYVGRDTTEPLPTSEGPQPIGPGSTIDFVLTEEVYTSLKNHLVGAGYPLKMKQAELLITDVFFADGTRWYKGMRLKRNPHNPVEWVKDAPNQVKVDRKPNPPNSLRASQAKAKFISANFYPGLMPSPGANRARPLGGAGLSAQVPCQEAKTPIDEVPCGMEVPGCIVKDDRVEGAPMEAPARLISGTKACTRPASDPGGGMQQKRSGLQARIL